jgi:hypothetical protein
MTHGPVEQAIRFHLREGQVLQTPTQGKPFKVGRIDRKGVVLLLGDKQAWTPFTWECLEGIVPFLKRHGGEVDIGGRHDVTPNWGTLDEHLKGCIARDTAGWVAVLLEEAGVVEVLRERPARVRLAG